MTHATRKTILEGPLAEAERALQQTYDDHALQDLARVATDKRDITRAIAISQRIDQIRSH